MTVFQALSLMIAFASLVVAIIFGVINIELSKKKK